MLINTKFMGFNNAETPCFLGWNRFLNNLFSDNGGIKMIDGCP